MIGETHTTFPVKWGKKVGGLVDDQETIAANWCQIPVQKPNRIEEYMYKQSLKSIKLFTIS